MHMIELWFTDHNHTAKTKQQIGNIYDYTWAGSDWTEWICDGHIKNFKCDL